MAKQSTRDLLIDVGLERMHTAGYASAGVKEILELAGVPKGSFYHYFPSKEAFAREVLLRYFTGESKRAAKILGNNKIAPLKRLRKYFDELISVYGPSGRVTGCMAGSLTLEMADHSDVLQSVLSESFSRWQSGIEAILRAAVERGDLAKGAKTNELAAFVLNSYEGALLRCKAERSQAPLDNFLHITFGVLLKK
jgi:TetR/AcrR family transcriptional repressor of nem operon